MILAVIWTALGVTGLIGAIRNVRQRDRNLDALRKLGLDGPVQLTATLFRNSELIRMTQALIGVAIGVAAIWLYTSPYYKAVQAARAAGAFPPPPLVVRVFNAAFQWGLFLWMALLVFNIFYFGAIGDRVARLTSRSSSSS